MKEQEWPPLWLCGVHLAALWTLAFVQPLFDILGKNAAFFVARDNTAGDVLILAFGWTLVPPLIALALVALARLIGPRPGRLVHLAFVAGLASVLLLQLVKGISPRASVVGPIALALGVAAAAAYARFAGLRTFVSILGVAPVVIVALLLLFTPVKDVVIPPGDAAAAAAPKPENPVPVVVLIFDELPTPSLMTRDKTVDAERYPNFARLAKTSTWYQNASSVSDGTYVAVPAILTGKRPQAELPTSREYPRNLYSLVGKNYNLFNQEPITSVCAESLCEARPRPAQGERLEALAEDLSIVERRLLLPKGMADKLPPIDRDFEEFQAEKGNDALAAAADEEAAPDDTATAAGQEPIRVAGDDLPAQRVKAARKVVRTMRPGGGKPGLWMVHYVIPHVPWRFLPDGSQYVVEGPTLPGINDQTWGSNRFLLDQAWQRHFLMMRFADRLLGDAIDQMQRSGLWEKALVLVVGDHGGSIGPKSSRRPVVKENFAGVASIPFFVKLPGQEKGATDAKFVTAMDVVPTIAKQLGIDNGWAFDGIPVDEPHPATELKMRNGREARLYSSTPERFARDRDRLLADQLRRFPSGLAGIWNVGPRRDLVGEPLTALTLGPGGDQSATIDNASLYEKVRPASGVIPVYVTGETKGVPAGTELAVAVNGRIRATGVAYVEHGDRRFSVVLEPESLRRGANRVEIVSVDGTSGRRLARTQ